VISAGFDHHRQLLLFRQGQQAIEVVRLKLEVMQPRLPQLARAEGYRAIGGNNDDVAG
jgi:hypothetical protein